MRKNLLLCLVLLLVASQGFATLTAYKHYNDSVGPWDQTTSTHILWNDQGGIAHLPTGNGNFPAGNAAFRGCVEFTPPARVFHHDYDAVVWDNAEGTFECWIAPHWNGENQGGVHPNGTFNDVLVGDGVGEGVGGGGGAQGITLVFFDNNAQPGYQLFAVFTDAAGKTVHQNYAVGNTMDWVAGEWHHICASWDATEVMVGLDGTIFMKQARNGGFDFAAGGYLFGMGKAAGPENTWDGWADDVSVSDVALYTGIGDQNDPYLTPTGPKIDLAAGKAWAPVPSGGTMVTLTAGSTLAWNAGSGAVTHEVYWSEDEDEVVNRTVTPIVLSIGTETTPTPSAVALGVTYYWVVDETDGTPTTYPGDLWQYTIDNFLYVDSMESYTNDFGNEAYDVWDDGYFIGDNGASVYQVNPGLDGTAQGLEFTYSNNGTNPAYAFTGTMYYSEAVALTSNLECGSNWADPNHPVLRLTFFGALTNDANEPMYIGIEDGAGTPNFAMVQYGVTDSYCSPKLPEDANNIRLAGEFEWNIDLRRFGGVDLSDVQKVYLGFGERGAINDSSRSGSPDHAGVVVIDEIMLTAAFATEAPDFLQSDVNRDFITDFKDLAVIANEWVQLGDDKMFPVDWETLSL